MKIYDIMAEILESVIRVKVVIKKLLSKANQLFHVRRLNEQ